MEVSEAIHAPATLSPGKNADTQWIECWVGPREILDVLGDRKISCPCRNSKNESSLSQPSPYAIEVFSLSPDWSRVDCKNA